MKKSHPHSQTEVNKIDLSDTFADNPLIQWISDNGRLLLWILAGAILLFLLFYRFAGGSSAGAESDYLNAESEFITFQKGVNGKADPAVQQAAFDKLNAILNRRPELHAKYDGLIAQALIDKGDIKGAVPYADRTLARINTENVNLYSDYAKTTLVIANQHYEEALKQALALKQQMIDNADVSVKNPEKKEFGDTLYTYNLLRIALLSQQIGDMGRELSAWEDFKTAASNIETNLYVVNADALNEVTLPFQEGKTSLKDYIQAREKILKQAAVKK